MAFTIRNTKDLPLKQVRELYNDVGWTKYTKDTDKISRAFQNSLLILSAWEAEELLGLIRIVGDGETIIYVQDLLVKEKAQRRGIATKLILQAIGKFPDVRQKVLITDTNPATVSFYESVGFKKSTDSHIEAFIKFEF